MVVKMGANSNNKTFQHVLRKANLLLIQVIYSMNKRCKEFIDRQARVEHNLEEFHSRYLWIE